MSRLSRSMVVAGFVLFCGLLSGDAGALSPEQCEFFSAGGRTAICHRTASAENPYTLLHVSTRACVAAHAGHPSDFVAVNGSCALPGTLPAGAPCDGTLACGEGLTCSNGFCTVPGSAGK